MAQPYDPINDTERNAHKSNTTSGFKAIHSSGDAHFYLTDQNNVLPALSVATGIFDRNGLGSPFSNGPTSKQYPPVKPHTNNYRTLNASRTINLNNILQHSTFEFNMYSQAFRR